MRTITSLLFLIFAFVFISYCTYIYSNQNNEVLLISTEKEDSTHTFLLSVGNNDYPQPKTLNFYPWDYIVEPFRRTTIEIMDTDVANGLVYWKFTRLNRESDGGVYYEDYGEFDTSIDIIEQGTTYLIMKFKQPGIVFQMDMTQYTDSTKKEILRTSSYQIASKFVRREIREMTGSDRTNFFDGLELMHRLTEETGQTLYGSKFRNSRHFSLKHLDKFNEIRCTPYHGGDVFFTSHTAFTLSYERSLQAMFPELAFPYWDYTIDNVLYGTNWSSSSIFDDDWFSPLISSTREENYPITEGRFAYTPVPVDYESPNHNAYGRITIYFNNNPLPYTSRSNIMCDINLSETSLPGCSILKTLLNQTTFHDFLAIAQDEFHTRLHALLGGYWDCRYKWGAWSDTHSQTWQSVIRRLAERVEIGYLSNKVNLTCPTLCEEGEKCSCECPEYSRLMKEGHGQSYIQDLAFSTLDSWLMLSTFFGGSPEEYFVSSPCTTNLLATSTSSDSSDSCTKNNYFKHIPPHEQAEFWPWLLDQVCTPAKFSDFASPFAAPFDPLFMPSHHNIMRWWSYFRILISENSGYEYFWDDDDACWAHKYTEPTGFGAKDVGYLLTKPGSYVHEEYFYTNQELDEYFHPFNPDLTYIYGSFDTTHCD